MPAYYVYILVTFGPGIYCVLGSTVSCHGAEGCLSAGGCNGAHGFNGADGCNGAGGCNGADACNGADGDHGCVVGAAWCISRDEFKFLQKTLHGIVCCTLRNVSMLYMGSTSQSMTEWLPRLRRVMA